MRRGTREIHVEVRGEASGTACQQHDAVAEARRLTHVVRDEHDGEPCLAPHVLELVVQQVARDGVERAERLVHEEDIRVLREGAGERDPLAHAAGELVGPLLREAAEVHEVEQLERPRAGEPNDRRHGGAARARCCRQQ